MEAKDRFLILRKIKYGEADLIIHALSSQGEKISFIARSALKSKKRFGGGVLEPSHFVQLTYKKAADVGMLNTLNEAILINDFKNLRRSYDHLEFALHVLECADRVSQEGDQTSAHLFNLVGHTLKAVEVCENLQTVKLQFYLKFLYQQGILTPEPWMSVFLKTNLQDVNSLKNEADKYEDHLSSLAVLVQQYLKTAEGNH